MTTTFLAARASVPALLLSLALAIIAGCGDDDGPRDDGGTPAMDSGGDRDAQSSDDDASTPGDDASTPGDDASTPGDDASTPGDDASTQPDGCVAPRCPPIPVGCDVEGGDACTCGTIVCPPTPCMPACSARTEYCMYATHCGGEGTCEVRPEACIDIFDPVCGCDGMTYSNSCDAAANGQSVAYDGECAAPAGDCRTEGCPDGATCEVCRGAGGPVYACIPRGAAC